MGAALFATIYTLLPDVKIAWGNVWIGAAVTALLFTLGKSLIGLYLGGLGTAVVPDTTAVPLTAAARAAQGMGRRVLTLPPHRSRGSRGRRS